MSATTRVPVRAATGPPWLIREPVVLALPRSVEAASLESALRRAGHEVFRVCTACDARRLVHMYDVSIVVLATDLRDESGWLTCAKLRMLDREVRVLLYGPESARLRRQAAFVGAEALLAEADAVVAWLQPTIVRLMGACS